VHQIRNTLNYISFKHRKEFAGNLRQVYAAITEEVALNELTLLEEKWTQKIGSWSQILSHLSIYFEDRIPVSVF